MLLSFILVSCSSNGANDEGELFIKVLDAPANYQQINIVVDRISIHRTGNLGDIGWTIVSTSSSGSFDLLNLRNGRNLQLVLSKVPVGTYDQIKLNYGACTIRQNAIATDYPLQLDQSIQLGQIIPYGIEIQQGRQAQLTFDYDVAKSIIQNSSGNIFKPIIRVQNTLLSGWITGSVLDSGMITVSAKISTYTGVDSVSTLNDVFPYGSFQLSDLPEGNYSVAIVPDDSKLIADTISNINVKRQTGTPLGAIHLKYR